MSMERIWKNPTMTVMSFSEFKNTLSKNYEYSFIIDYNYDSPILTNTLRFAQFIEQTQKNTCMFCYICDIV